MSDFGIPTSGGNSYYTKAFLQAKEQLSHSYQATHNALNRINRKVNAENFTYNLGFLLMQQADYFTNLVRFRVENDKTLTENIYKVIRCAVVYGRAAFWKTTNYGLIPLYINNIKFDEFNGTPTFMSACLIDNVFSQKEIIPNNHNWVSFDREDMNDVYILNSSSTGFGGLIRGQPFLKQLENLLKMLYTHSYSYLKFISYDVKDVSFLDNELDLFFNTSTPFLINLGDNSLLQNKFKEFNFANTNKNDFFTYLQNFLNTYYSLIGRRYNVDYKKERNVKDEVNASQDNFDILQNELKQYIYLMLDGIESVTNSRLIFEDNKLDEGALDNERRISNSDNIGDV